DPSRRCFNASHRLGEKGYLCGRTPRRASVSTHQEIFPTRGKRRVSGENGSSARSRVCPRERGGASGRDACVPLDLLPEHDDLPRQTHSRALDKPVDAIYRAGWLSFHRPLGEPDGSPPHLGVRATVDLSKTRSPGTMRTLVVNI